MFLQKCPLTTFYFRLFCLLWWRLVIFWNSEGSLWGLKDFGGSKHTCENEAKLEAGGNVEDSADRNVQPCPTSLSTRYTQTSIFTRTACLFSTEGLDLRRELRGGRPVRFKQTTTIPLFNSITFYLNSSFNDRRWQKAALSQFALFNVIMWHH